MISQKETALLSTLSHALDCYSDQIDADLGDRTAYVGLSDVGRGMECLRTAVAAKFHPSSRPVNQDYDSLMRHFRRQLTMQRGHWQEYGIGSALRACGLKSISQMEIGALYSSDGGVPVKAHLDFTLLWDKPRPAIRVLELKSNERLPETLYPSYETQLYGQITLLREAWNKPAFGLCPMGRSSYVTFPELALQLFGVTMPTDPTEVDIEGWVVSLGMSDAKVFGPYTPNTAMLQACLQTAGSIWRTTQAIQAGTLALDDIDYCKGFHPLCDWCESNADCPKYRGIDAWNTPEVAAALETLSGLKTSKKDIEDRIKDLEGRIRRTYMELPANGAWVAAGSHRFRTSIQPGRETIDRDALREELMFLCDGDEIRVDSVMRSITKTGDSFPRLWVSPVNNPTEPETLAA